VVVARQGIGNGRVVAGFDDHLVKAHVQVVVGLQVIFGHEALVEQLVALTRHCSSAARPSGESPRSAAWRAASPSSTPRTSTAPAMSSALTERT
jgi:hypothetical protein